MALDLTKLERMSGGLKKVFVYDAGADTIATVTGAGYFNNARDQLDKCDVIHVISNTQAAIDTIFVNSTRAAHGSASGGGAAGNVTTISVEGVTAT